HGRSPSPGASRTREGIFRLPSVLSPERAGEGGSGLLAGAGLGEDLVDQAVLLGFLGAEVLVALGVGADAVGRLPGVARDDLDELGLGLDDLLGLDADVLGLPVHAAVGLVDHHLGVGQDEPLALVSGGEEDGAARVG